MNQEAFLDRTENLRIILSKLKGENFNQINQEVDNSDYHNNSINESNNDNDINDGDNKKDIDTGLLLIDNPIIYPTPIIELLKTLSLSGCKLKSDGVSLLFNDSMKWRNLKSLNLSDNLIGPIGCRILADYISKHLKSKSIYNLFKKELIKTELSMLHSNQRLCFDSESDRELDRELDGNFLDFNFLDESFLELKQINLSNNQLVGMSIVQSNIIGI